MSSSTDRSIQIVKPEFLYRGNYDHCPIPRDSPNIKCVDFISIKAGAKIDDEDEYDQTWEAQGILLGEQNDGYYSHLSIPFSSSSPMKGAYIYLGGAWNRPEYLIFTLTSSTGVKTAKKYNFPDDFSWYFLPVDLPDVVLCEIIGKGREKEYFGIASLVFISREEIKARETREKLWSEATVVKPEFVQEGYHLEVRESYGRDSIPILHDNPKILNPAFSMVQGHDDSYCEKKYYDKSCEAQGMLKGKYKTSVSHLSIPFPSPSPMKGAYICVNKCYSSPSLLFTFTDCDGKKTFKKYEFITRPKHEYEWHFLPIDLGNVVLCEIEGKGMWSFQHSRCFWICSLVFTVP
ncbi:hypothetical protein ADUPG1_000031 [Aduncisulcus paluster]|uniref:Uncharacterized protein n=1 Tax=Aduncisulcus paluster TaxID=2918883 RepID=A0ABQ5K4D4_9EUKA|nr:hypothetical protein ADUPG1_000031 [Aduncisulcus paluster]